MATYETLLAKTFKRTDLHRAVKNVDDGLKHAGSSSSVRPNDGLRPAGSNAPSTCTASSPLHARAAFPEAVQYSIDCDASVHIHAESEVIEADEPGLADDSAELLQRCAIVDAHDIERTKPSSSSVADSFLRRTLYQFSEYEKQPLLWTKQSPWNASTIRETAREIFERSPIFGDLIVLDLAHMCSDEEGELPTVVRVLLELVSWRDLALKTSAMEFLIRVFHLRTSMARAIQETIFVVDPLIASHFFCMRPLLQDFRMHVQHLSRNAEKVLSASADDTFSDIAFQRLLRILTTLTGMAHDSASTPAGLRTMQAVMMDVGVFEEGLALLRIPWKRCLFFLTCLSDVA